MCDLPYHFNERPDLPRTLYSAFFNYDGSLQEALETASPLHLVDKMPLDSSYCIFHCEQDSAVNKQIHSDRFVKEMEKAHRIVYYAVPDREHCDLTPEMTALYYQHIIAAFTNR